MKTYFLLFIVLLNTNYVSTENSTQFNDLSQVNLTNLEDNSLFNRWRPTYHFASPNSWMNDPCAPLYNPSTQNYHLYYQVQPGYVQWGNISWGHAKSKDMIFWEDVTSWQGDHYVALAPGVGNNQSTLGVFTGSALPVSINGSTNSGAITAIYTSVKYLPISWNGPYQQGSETQSLAVSYDDGTTFQEYIDNPIIPSPPSGWNVTGWRDPKFEKWTQMDSLLYGSDQGNYYMSISSGIRGLGPRLLLYQASTNDLTNWTYIGPLIAVNDNYTLNEMWSSSLGFNFEVANVFSLLETPDNGGDNQTIHHFASLGTEGGNTTLHPSTHWSVWVQGNLITNSNGSVTMNITASGVSDWGDTYALNSFYDTLGNRRIFYGWVTEDNNYYGERAFGYNGQFTLPREVFVQVYNNVVNINGSLSQQGPWTTISNDNGTYTCKTLGVRPISEVTNLRNNTNVTHFINQTFTQPTNFTSLNISSSNFELQAMINISSNTTAGFVFRSSPDGSEYTTLTYNPISEYLILNRTFSSLIKQFVNNNIYAKHTLLTTMINANNSQKELLSLRIFIDNSLLEVYANNRTVITTHIYPALSNSTTLGYIVDGQGGPVTFTHVTIWSNLQNAFPQRPLNTSIALFNINTETTTVSTLTTTTPFNATTTTDFNATAIPVFNATTTTAFNATTTTVFNTTTTTTLNVTAIPVFNATTTTDFNAATTTTAYNATTTSTLNVTAIPAFNTTATTVFNATTTTTLFETSTTTFSATSTTTSVETTTAVSDTTTTSVEITTTISDTTTTTTFDATTTTALIETTTTTFNTTTSTISIVTTATTSAVTTISTSSVKTTTASASRVVNIHSFSFLSTIFLLFFMYFI